MAKASRARKLILFLVSPQIDFIGLPHELASDEPSSVHVGETVVRNLREEGRPDSDPLVDLGLAVLSHEEIESDLIVDEDWHPDNWWEFRVFHGKHCVKGTPGARLPDRLERRRWDDNFHYIRANSINISTDPSYRTIMEQVVSSTPRSDIRIAVAGVYTHIKVDYLILNLLTAEPSFPHKSIAVLDYLCGSPDQGDHDAAIRKFDQLNIEILNSQNELEDWIGLEHDALQAQEMEK